MFAPPGVDSESSDEDVSPITSPSPSPARAKFSLKSLIRPPKLSSLRRDDFPAPRSEPASSETPDAGTKHTLRRLKRRVRILASGDDKPTTNKGEETEAAEDPSGEAIDQHLAGPVGEHAPVKDEEKDPAAVEMLSLLRQVVAQQAISSDTRTAFQHTKADSAEITPKPPIIPLPEGSPNSDHSPTSQPQPGPPVSSAHPTPAYRSINRPGQLPRPGLNYSYYHPESSGPPQSAPPAQAWVRRQDLPQQYAPPQSVHQHPQNPHPHPQNAYHHPTNYPPPMYPHPHQLQPWHPSNMHHMAHGYESAPLMSAPPFHPHTPTHFGYIGSPYPPTPQWPTQQRDDRLMNSPAAPLTNPWSPLPSDDAHRPDEPGKPLIRAETDDATQTCGGQRQQLQGLLTERLDPLISRMAPESGDSTAEPRQSKPRPRPPTGNSEPASEGRGPRPFAGMLSPHTTDLVPLRSGPRREEASVEWSKAFVSLAICADVVNSAYHRQATESDTPKIALLIRLAKSLASGQDIPAAFETVFPLSR